MSAASNQNLNPRVAFGAVSNLPGWVGPTSHQEIEARLEGQAPYTYILRPTGENHQFYISFVDQDRSIQHRVFTQTATVFKYKNGDLHQRDNLEDLIRVIMHCTQEFRPFRWAKS